MNYTNPKPCAKSKGTRIHRKKAYRLSALMALLTMMTVVSCKKETSDPPDDTPIFGTCTAVTPTGRFSIETDGKFTYYTSGGGKIVIDHALDITVTHEDYPGFFIDFWGAVSGGAASYNHENLNGKHVKDRIGNRRTLLFPDGAKMTWYTETEKGSTVSLTIYDHGEVHHVNPGCNTLEYSVVNTPVTEKALDDKEPDGETATFEFTTMGLEYYNIYQEDVAGQKVMNKVPIGEIFRDEPNRVIDYWNFVRSLPSTNGIF